MDFEGNPDRPPDPEYPYDINLIQEQIVREFGVSIDRAKDIFTVTYGEDTAAKTGGRFKYTIFDDLEYGKVMVITRESTRFQIVIAPTTYKQIIPDTQDSVEVKDICVLQKRQYQPSVTLRPKYPNSSRRKGTKTS
jgi:membrane protease subunit (stomatin/prohibitin family)